MEVKKSISYLASKNSFKSKYLYSHWFLFYLRILLGIVLTLLFTIEGVFSTHVQATPQSVIKTLSNAAQQEQLGREYYQADQFSAALEIWQQTLRVYQSQGDRLNQARVLSNLSLTYRQLGQWNKATQAITDSLKLVQVKGNLSVEQLKVLAQALNTQGTLQLATGKPEVALLTWQEAANTYKKAKSDGVIRSLINQSQALKSLGLYRKASSTLEGVNKILQEQADSPTKAAALRNLGNSLRLVGNLERAQEVLNASLTVAQKLQLPSDISSALLALGNVAYTNQKPESALVFYQQAANIASLIATSHKQAKDLGDKRLEAYALGKLGRLYEQTQQFENAQKLTEKALILAQAMNSPEISYRWHGSILQTAK